MINAKVDLYTVGAARP